MIISSSYSATKTYKFSTIHFALKHFIFAFFSLILIHFFSKQHKSLQPIGLIIWVINVVLLVGVILFGHSAKGAKRWISLLGFNFQPSEFIKIGIILQSSYFLKNNLYLYFLTYFIPIVFIAMQPDLGTALLLLCLACGQLIIKNDEINFQFLIIGALLIIFMIFMGYFTLPHVHERIDLFFKAGKDIYGIGYQKHKAFLTIASGGLIGKGFGRGEIKDFLPDAHTDYIFAVIVEEFGYLGGLLIIVLFILLGLRCRQLTAHSEYLGIVQYSAIILILGQTWLNIASTLSIIPSKGITMPLVSYGGSGIITQGIIFGILLAVSEKKSKIEKITS